MKLLTNASINKWQRGKVVVANLLRILMGILYLIVSFFLIITKPTILKLVMGYAGAAFMAGLDEMLYKAAQAGFLTPTLLEQANKIESETFPDASKNHLRYRRI